MRRALAITLLLVLFAPLAAPPLEALTADPEGGLPPCCRSHGMHHCAMLHWMLQHANSGTPALAPAPCARYPAMFAVPQLVTFAPATAPLPAAELRPGAVRAIARERAALLFPASLHTTRGPPSAMGRHF